MARSFAPIAVVGLARMLGSGLAPAMLDCTSLTTCAFQFVRSIPDRLLNQPVGAPGNGCTFLAVTTPSTMEAKVLMVVGDSCFFS